MSSKAAIPIAIVGMGAIFPGRGDVTGFWRDVFEGRDLLSDVPASHWLVEDYYDSDPLAKDKTYGRRGGFIDPVAFDPLTFGIPPKTMEGTDTAQLLALVAAYATLQDIERDSEGRIDKSRTSVILGVASATELTAHMAGRLQRPVWVNAMREAGLPESEVLDLAKRIENHYVEWQEATFPGLLGNVVAGRIANRFDLGGSNMVTDAACASSLSALSIALHELRAGDSDTVLTGGVDALNDILMYMCFSKTPALSPTGDCRPFSNAADGTMLGEGVGMLALRRLEDAERDGNTIHAVIRGLGGGSDGKGTAIYAPVPEGQARALKRAYDQAGYGPEAIDLMEGHGTGTKAGDKAELDGLHLVFGDVESDDPWCALGSVKSQMGHSKAAAGAASLVKVVNALSRKILPPTAKVEEPADVIKDSGVFYLNTEARPWITTKKRPRRASVSSFGFGGSNYHVTLEEYVGKTALRPYRVFPAELFLFSADSPDALAAAIEASASGVDDASLAHAASQTHAGFEAKAPARAAIIAETADDLKAKSESLASQIRAGEVGIRPFKADCFASLDAPVDGKIAFMFSGQGSQYVGMGSDLAMAFPEARAVWDQAASHKRTGKLRLDKLSFPPAAFDQVDFGAQTQTLTEMQHAQPAIAAVALAQLGLLSQLGLQADMAAGHSFGEIMALHLAGVMDSDTALTVAAERGALMAKAAGNTKGAMLAVQTDSATIAPVLKKIGQGLVLANDNGPDQVVLSGAQDIVEQARVECETLGLKARMLPVATAFHSEIVAEAVPPFAKVLAKQKLRAPKLDVFANATAQKYDAKVADLPACISDQLIQPVRFREQVEAMYAAGARVFVEVGPGGVVTGLVGHILADKPHLAVSLDHKRRNGVNQFLLAIATLGVSGIDLDYADLFADLPAQPPKPAPSKHAVKISGGNYNKPYPPANGAAGRAPPNPEKPSVQDRPAAQFQSTSNPVQAPPSPRPEHKVLPEQTGSPMTQDTSSKGPEYAVHSHSTMAPAAMVSERIMQEVSQRHADYMSAMSTAHSAFLNVAAQMAGQAPLEPVRTQAPVALPAPAPAAQVQPQPPAMDVKPNGAYREVEPAAAPAPLAVPVPAAQPAPQPQASVQPAPMVAPAPVPSASGGDSISLVRGIIAEKTGYPEDMLEPDMDLEGELGVDSIKQVEILSTLRERMPSLPEIDPEQLVELRTIAAIAGMIDASGVASAPAPAMSAAPATVTASSNGGVTADTVRALIAEKTGYPEDMLEDDMDLEGELGVDSIKQVEILSALRDQHPELPEVDPEVLADLRTIRAIADFFA
ncbi:beta-ketoacyl synthase N-terminal-like domain-containing protein [uncultured Hyphomonas sp.]|uniref:beta-ketoacyl synthase N-terminal-like domain-containing protein n=1 Tax=uncultured Hyphomonas sp. TaxID=225298 RepID=UPI0030D9C600|tara:strand:- start:400058 stop:403984 length:3927 start_codon:yes stop_codon:yes gene_type:complete